MRIKILFLLTLVFACFLNQIGICQDTSSQPQAAQVDSKYPKDIDDYGGKAVLDAEQELDNGHYAQGNKMLLKELDLAKQANDISKQVLIYDALANSYINTENYFIARSYVDKALQILSKSDSNKGLYILNLVTLSRIDIEQNNLDAAQNCLDTVKHLSLHSVDLQLKLEITRQEASIQSYKGNYRQSIILLKNCLIYLDNHNYLSKYLPDQYIDTISQLATAYFNSSNYSLSKLYYTKALSLINKYNLSSQSLRKYILNRLKELNYYH